MGLEVADYISELVPTNPVETDQVAQADDHMRLTKKCVQQSFPNIDAEVTATAADLNILTGSGEEGRGVAAFASGDQILMTSGAVPPGWTLSEVHNDRVLAISNSLDNLGHTGGSWNNADGLTNSTYTVDGVNVHFLGGGGLETPSEGHRHTITSDNSWRPSSLIGVVIQKD